MRLLASCCLPADEGALVEQRVKQREIQEI